jgi:hypothetical protein
MTDIEKVHELLKESFNKKLFGLWIDKKNGYEKEFCKLTGLIHKNTRYMDCTLGDNICIELKKGKGAVWLDEVRYSEILLRINEDSKIKTFTVFIKYKPGKVTSILIIKTEKLIESMGLTIESAEYMLAKFKKTKSLGHGLNCQHSMSYKQLTKIADFIIE